MRVCFCVWCVKCAKYLAFDTFERADDSALSNKNDVVLLVSVKSIMEMDRMTILKRKSNLIGWNKKILNF